MLNVPLTISELITRWPTVRTFAADIGVGLGAAEQMKKRNQIAPQHWASVIQAAGKRKIPGIDHDWLMARYRRTTRRAA